MRNTAPDLRILLFEVTQKCNARCDHCGSRCDIDSEELLTADEILGVLRDVKENIGTDVMINITGGEPLMRKDLFSVMKQASSMGFDWGLVTNGTLISERVIHEMKQSGLRTITVSIDGTKETHESLRHLPGSYDRILNNLRKLKKAKFLDHIQVTFTSNKRNYRELPELYAQLEKIGIDSLRTSCIDPIGRACEHEELLLGREELEFLYRFANEKNKKGRLPIEWGCCHYTGNKLNNRIFRCFAGIYSASILYNGDIFVCPNVPRRPELIQGNIKKDRFSEVWKNRYEWFRNKPLPDMCTTCPYVEECDGDSVHTFDFDRKEPLFCYRRIFDIHSGEYAAELARRYKDFRVETIASEEPAADIWIEPEAYADIRQYFHMGTRHPLSIFEQQVGLVGFKVDNDYVIKYVFPSINNAIAADAALFTPATMSHAMRQTKIICQNHPLSDFKDDYIGEGLKFLGFAHSHPVQEELCYSIGDEMIHNHLCKKYGDYIGILIYPSEDLIGAYYGNPIRQGNLKLITKNDPA